MAQEVLQRRASGRHDGLEELAAFLRVFVHATLLVPRFLHDEKQHKDVKFVESVVLSREPPIRKLSIDIIEELAEL